MYYGVLIVLLALGGHWTAAWWLFGIGLAFKFVAELIVNSAKNATPRRRF